MTTRILICDDSALARKQMARALPEGLRGDVSFAKDGVEALEKLRGHEAELMFLDLNMPEVDGYQVLEQVRKEDLPVLTIVVSGDIQPEARERVRKLIFNKHKRKHVFMGPRLAKMSNGSRLLDKKVCMESMEALKPFGDS